MRLAVAGLLLVAMGTPLHGQEGTEPLSLERAIQTALANSYDINAAEQGVRLADQQVRQAWANVLPDVSVNASYQRNLRVQQGFLPAIIFNPNASPDEVIPVRFGSDNTWQAGLQFTQPLFEYNVLIGLSAAGRFRSLENERMRGTTQGVVSAVRQAYLDALLAEENARLLENSVARVRQTLEETRALNRAGLSSDYDVLRLEVELGNLEPNLRRAENRVAEARRTLMIELGLEPSGRIALEGRLVEVNPDSIEANSPENRALLALTGMAWSTAPRFDDLYTVALRRRSTLRQQRLNIDVEQARMMSIKAEYVPKLSLFSNYNILAQENGSPTFFGDANTRTTSAVTGISISVPLFQGFSRDARVQQSHATMEQDQARLARAEKEVENELRTTLDQLEEALLRVRSQRRAVAQATRGFEIASAEYREGVGSQLQVTDAESALRQSEFNYAQAVYDYLIARVRLDAAVGTVPTAAGELASLTEDRED